MSHLNYFVPYQSKSQHHEDQLTRAFLVVLKYSPAAMMRFYSYCMGEAVKLAIEENNPIHLPYLHELPLQQISLFTQISRYQLKAVQILSVLITDQSLKVESSDAPVQISDRRAVYDGIIQMGDDLILLIENKPDARNVWRGQLNPSSGNIQEDNESILIQVPAILEWRNIIQHLNDLLEIEAVSGMEKMLIADFLEFVDRCFVALNPYQRFSQCKNNKGLLTRRIGDILETKFAQNEPGYHRGWAHYIMAGLPEVKQIGVRLAYTEADSNNWQIEISMYFGDIMQQARDTYKRTDLNSGYLQHLRGKGWLTYTNPHISMQSKNWYFFNIPENDNVEPYIKYWQDNQSEMRQYFKPELREKLKQWADLGLIQLEGKGWEDYDYKLRNVQDTTKFNWCPGFRILYFISAKEAIQRDDAGKFDVYLREKFNEGLRVLGDEFGEKF